MAHTFKATYLLLHVPNMFNKYLIKLINKINVTEYRLLM